MSLETYRSIRRDVDKPFTPVGAHTQVTTLGSAVVLDPPAGATRILLQTVTQNIRYRLDGVNPVANVGFRQTPTDGPVTIECPGGIRVIQESPSATIDYQWGR